MSSDRLPVTDTGAFGSPPPPRPLPNTTLSKHRDPAEGEIPGVTVNASLKLSTGTWCERRFSDHSYYGQKLSGT